MEASRLDVKGWKEFGYVRVNRGKLILGRGHNKSKGRDREIQGSQKGQWKRNLWFPSLSVLGAAGPEN